MSISKEVLDRFTAGTRTDEVQFVKNDAVLVLTGPNKKRTGAVVSIFSLDPVTTYLIEPSSEPWGDFQAGQANIELVES